MPHVTPPLHERATRAVLAAVARSRTLLDDYVLKGGFTLHHVFGSPRRSYDLDFTAIKPFSKEVTPEKKELLQAFCGLLEDEMDRTGPSYGLGVLRVHWRAFSDEIPVLLARIGYAEEHTGGQKFDQYVEAQITLSEIICETTRAEIEGIPVHVPILEDVLADKLKALLQQVARDVNRTHDLYDLWYFTTRSGRVLDIDRILRYFLTKSGDWPDLFPMTRSRFHDPAVRQRARATWDEIPPHLSDPTCIIPYDAAFDAVLAFVDTLRLPDT